MLISPSAVILPVAWKLPVTVVSPIRLILSLPLGWIVIGPAVVDIVPDDIANLPSVADPVPGPV